MTSVARCITIESTEEGRQMKVEEEEVKHIVREETARWLASIWREPEPNIEFTTMDGLDPTTYAPSTQGGRMIALLKSCESVRIWPHGSAEVSTGISVTIPKRTCAIILPDRELDLHFCVATSAVIGAGDSDVISLRLYNFGEYDYKVEKGQTIAQMLIVPALEPNYMIGEK